MEHLQIGYNITTTWNTIQMEDQFSMATSGYLKLAILGQYTLAQGGHYAWIFHPVTCDIENASIFPFVGAVLPLVYSPISTCDLHC